MILFGTDGIRGRYGDFPLDDSTIKKSDAQLQNHSATLLRKLLLDMMEESHVAQF